MPNWLPVGPETDPDEGSGGTSTPPSVALPAVPVRTPPLDTSTPRGNAVRLYDINGKRKKLPSYQIGESRWTVEPKGGYADGSVPLYFSPGVDLPNIADGDCIEIWAQGNRQWRGIVSDVTISDGEPAEITVAGYGRILDLERMVLQGAYQEPAPVDVSYIFGMIAADIQARYPDITTYCPVAIGVNLQTLDCRLKTAREALDSLYEACAGVAVYGFDVDPSTGADRLYLRLVNSATADYSIPIPSPNVGNRSLQRRAADVVNQVIVEGGTMDYPQLLPNGSFEALVRPSSADGGSFVLNGDFNLNSSGSGHDHNSDHWGRSSTAVFIQGGQNGKPAAFSGSWFAELDSIGEWVEQISDTPTVALIAGHSYEFGSWIRPELSTNFLDPPQVTITFTWRASGAVMSGQTFTKVCSITEATYQQFYSTTPCPAGATGFGIHVQLTGGDSGSNHGVAVGYVYGVDVSALKADKWDFWQNGSAQVLTANWRARDAFDGLNCLYLSCTSSNTDGHDLHIRCKPSYLYEITGGETYRITARFKSGPAGNAIPALELQTWWYKSDGTYSGVGLYRHAVASAIMADWTYIHWDITAPGDCVKAESWVAVRGSGDLFVDALSGRCISVDPAFSDEDISDTTYLPAGNLLAVFRADIEVGESENAAVNGSVSTYGLRERVEHADVTTITDARTFAHAYLLAHAIPSPTMPIDLYDDSRPWAIGLGVAIVGASAILYGSSIKPVMRIGGSIAADGLLTQALELSKPLPTDEEIVLGIIKRTTETSVSEASGAASSNVPGNTPGYTAQPPAAGSAVTSLNTATGAVIIEGSGGIAVSQSGEIVTIDGSGISSGSGETVAAGTGIAVSVSGTTATVGIASGGVGTTQLAAGAVTGTNIAANAVDTTQLNAGSVTAAKIASGAVGSAQIAPGGVATSNIANLAVDTAEIANNAVTSAKMSATGITPGSYTNVNVTVDTAGRITAIANGSSGGGGSTNAFVNTAYTSAGTITTSFTAENILSFSSTIAPSSSYAILTTGIWTLVNAQNTTSISITLGGSGSQFVLGGGSTGLSYSLAVGTRIRLLVVTGSGSALLAYVI